MEEVKLTFFERDEIYENNLNEEISNAYIVNFISGENEVRAPIVGEYSPKKLFDYFDLRGRFNFDETSVLTKDKILLNSFENIILAEPDQVINIPSLETGIVDVEIRGEVIFPGTYK